MPEALAAPLTELLSRCSLNEYVVTEPDWQATMQRAPPEPKRTVAVLDLGTLARPGGLLDQLSATGYEVTGPAWKFADGLPVHN